MAGSTLDASQVCSHIFGVGDGVEISLDSQGDMPGAQCVVCGAWCVLGRGVESMDAGAGAGAGYKSWMEL